ncbi:hypothetical protein QJQ45_017140 [Haematococcus lacustris]|nr:hypothetical protein QJQ45_017140 [Haematococcus lacustris]
MISSKMGEKRAVFRNNKVLPTPTMYALVHPKPSSSPAAASPSRKGVASTGQATSLAGAEPGSPTPLSAVEERRMRIILQPQPDLAQLDQHQSAARQPLGWTPCRAVPIKEATAGRTLTRGGAEASGAVSDPLLMAAAADPYPLTTHSSSDPVSPAPLGSAELLHLLPENLLSGGNLRLDGGASPPPTHPTQARSCPPPAEAAWAAPEALAGWLSLPLMAGGAAPAAEGLPAQLVSMWAGQGGGAGWGQEQAQGQGQGHAALAPWQQCAVWHGKGKVGQQSHGLGAYRQGSDPVQEPLLTTQPLAAQPAQQHHSKAEVADEAAGCAASASIRRVPQPVDLQALPTPVPASGPTQDSCLPIPTHHPGSPLGKQTAPAAQSVLEGCTQQPPQPLQWVPVTDMAGRMHLVPSHLLLPSRPGPGSSCPAGPPMQLQSACMHGAGPMGEGAAGGLGGRLPPPYDDHVLHPGGGACLEPTLAYPTALLLLQSQQQQQLQQLLHQQAQQQAQLQARAQPLLLQQLLPSQHMLTQVQGSNPAELDKRGHIVPSLAPTLALGV